MRLSTLTLLSTFLALVHALPYRGADFSSLILLEESGLTYTSASSPDAAPQPFETLLAENGANLARIRVWTSTNYSDYSLTYALDMARRAQDAGMSLLVDLHYSDTWADPGKQAIPSGWPQDLAGLETQIYNYTRDLVASFAAHGTPIQFLQIGNEINDGLLWPTGQISVNGYAPASQLLRSAAAGVRAAASPPVRITVHIANGWDGSAVAEWWAGILGAEDGLALTSVDMMGFSFYPFYGTGATLAALNSSLQNVVSLYDKDLMVVETDWPAVCTNTSLSEPTIPISVTGQQEWVDDIKTVLAGLPSERGLGISYWEPGWVGNAALGSTCADNLLVDSEGYTRPSIDMFFTDM